MLTALLETQSTAAAAGEGSWLIAVVQFLPLLLVIVAMYFILIRPQRKREKESQKMRNNLQVGDEVTTSGGIVGRVGETSNGVIIENCGNRADIKTPTPRASVARPRLTSRKKKPPASVCRPASWR